MIRPGKAGENPTDACTFQGNMLVAKNKYCSSYAPSVTVKPSVGDVDDGCIALVEIGGFRFCDGGKELVTTYLYCKRDSRRSSVCGSRRQRHRALGEARERVSHSVNTVHIGGKQYHFRTSSGNGPPIAPRKQGMVPPLITCSCGGGNQVERYGHQPLFASRSLMGRLFLS